MLKLRSLAAALAIVALSSGALAQDYPAKPIRLIIAFSPGGSIDVLGRLVAAEMEKSTGQPVVVENIGGAGGIVGTEVVAKSDPDGYTVALVSPGAISVAAALGRDLAYDPTALTPIVNLASYVPALIARADLPVKDAGELIAYGKERPGELSYAVSGVGSSTHIMGELFKEAAQLDMVAIPFPGGGEVMQGLLSGDVDLAVTSYATVEAQVQARQVKVLTVFDTERYHTLADVPAITEHLPDFTPPVIWFGVFGPPGVPAEIAEKFNAEAINAMNVPAVAEQLDRLAYQVIGGSPADFAAFLETDLAQMQEAVLIAKLTEN